MRDPILDLRALGRDRRLHRSVGDLGDRAGRAASAGPDPGRRASIGRPAVRSLAAAVLWGLVLSACNAAPAATPFQPIILAFRGSTCDELAAEFGAIGDPSLRSVVDGPNPIADERMSVLVKKMESLLVAVVTDQAREAGVIADCKMPEWLQRAERGFSDDLRQTIGAAAYDGSPVISYQAWLLELNDSLVALGMGKG